ncbi:insulin isoform X2 [Aethina tumida]|nr:insulin isoform X2 [Aethina tumida]
MYKILVVFCCVYLMVVDASPYYKMDKRKQLCGEKLGKALSLICEGMYYNPKAKKNYIDDLLNPEYNDGVEDMMGWEMSYPFLTEESARNFVPIKGRRGIVDECCYKSCSTEHLKLYCAA